MNIFIGSSGNALRIAQAIKKNLARILHADIQCWNDKFFEPEDGTLENLYKKVIFYDFAVFVATIDDALTQKRIRDHNTISTKKCQAVRDNVVFEYGLFSGALGKKHVFLVVEEGADIPTDFYGVTHIRVKTKKDKDGRKSLLEPKKCYQKLAEVISSESMVSRISLLPSTASAFSYYDNFLTVVSKAIMNAETIYVGDQMIRLDPEKTTIHVVLPKQLAPDLKPCAQKYYAKEGVEEAKLKLPQKDFSFKVKYDIDRIDIYDVPVILSSSFRAVTLYIGEDYIGPKPEVHMCLQRETEGFAQTLRHLIERDVSFKEYIEFNQAD